MICCNSYTLNIPRRDHKPINQPKYLSISVDPSASGNESISIHHYNQFIVQNNIDSLPDLPDIGIYTISGYLGK